MQSIRRAAPEGLSTRNLLVADFKRKLSRPKFQGKAAEKFARRGGKTVNTQPALSDDYSIILLSRRDQLLEIQPRLQKLLKVNTRTYMHIFCNIPSSFNI
jgi:hypothetical protein